MAVRDEVENLIRRGNIFYWRPRVPRTFSRCSSDAQLSLSLNASDHRKAQYLARRLNTLLAELKHGPAAEMITKEQSAKLFAAERDAMHEHLDNVALMSRRNGRGRMEKHRYGMRSRTAAEASCFRFMRSMIHMKN